MTDKRIHFQLLVTLAEGLHTQHVPINQEAAILYFIQYNVMYKNEAEGTK